MTFHVKNRNSNQAASLCTPQDHIADYKYLYVPGTLYFNKIILCTHCLTGLLMSDMLSFYELLFVITLNMLNMLR